MEMDNLSTYSTILGIGSPTGTVTRGEDVNHEITCSFDDIEFFDFVSYSANGQEGGSQIHKPCSPQTQPLGDQHHDEEPAPDEDIIALAGDNCMQPGVQSTLPRPAFTMDKGPCDHQSRTKNEPSRYKGRRGRSGEGIIIREKIPRFPRKTPKKRPRSRNWIHEEVASLLELKSSASNSGNRITDWKLISRMLKEDSSIIRSAKECENQWGTAMKCCRKLEKELESRKINPGDQIGWKTFWEEKGGNTFNLECFEIMNRILTEGAQTKRPVKKKVHGEARSIQVSPASTSRAPRASSTWTSENLDNSEGYGNEQRPGSSTQLDNPINSLVECLAPGGDQDRTNTQMLAIMQRKHNLDELRVKIGRLEKQFASKGREYKSKGIECNSKKVEWESKKIERERIKIERDRIKEELDSTVEELQVELQK